jgi:hypothetical protein
MWYLRDHLTACLVSGRLILLDTKRDRYFALPPESMRAALEWLQAGDGSPAPAILGELFADGRGEPLSNAARLDVALPVPAATYAPMASPGFRQIVSVSAAVVATGMLLRVQGLGALLERQRRLRQTASVLEPKELALRAQTFRAARRWCPVARNCLLDSLAIDRWLGSPAGVRLVFGVIAQPFEAHCWVQSDRDVLNDSYDRVSRFEPILSL